MGMAVGLPLPSVAPEVPVCFGQHAETYSLGCIARTLWKKKVLRDDHWLAASTGKDNLTYAINCAIEEVVNARLPPIDNLGRFRLVWSDNMNTLSALQSLAPLGAFAIVGDDEPQMFVVGYALWSLNNAHPGVGTAIWSVLCVACEITLAGMTPCWAKDKAEEWHELYNDAVTQEDIETAAEIENFDYGVYGVHPKMFVEKLPIFVYAPPRVTKRTLTLLEKTLHANILSTEHARWIELAINLLTVLRRKRATRNYMWQFAGSPQLPGIAVAWKASDDPSYRIFDEYIDEFRQCGDEGPNVFVVPFDRALHPQRNQSAFDALVHIADAIEAAHVTLTLCNYLSNATAERNAPRRQRIRVGATLVEQYEDAGLEADERGFVSNL